MSQFDDIRKVLENEKHIVLVFIHGWHHDAARGDENVRKFRILLAYTESFRRQRCELADRYCKHRVVGIYVGWRGRSFVDCNTSVCVVGAFPTLWSRKAVSEGISSHGTAKLMEINNLLRQKDTSEASFYDRNKMLLVGHSLGGNMFATGLHDAYAALIARQADQRGRVMTSPLGDLVVLINPAAEATKWTDLQRLTNVTMGLSDSDPVDSLKRAGFFSSDQRPIYLSLTSACAWPALAERANTADKKIDCDSATAYLFPLHKYVVGEWSWQRSSCGSALRDL